MPDQPGGAAAGGGGRAIWARVTPAEGSVLDLLRVRMSWHYAPHIHEDYSIGACSEGVEVIRYRGTAHYSGPGSVVILEPGEPHTGGPAGISPFAYRAMYPAGALLRDGGTPLPRFPQPVVTDPALAAGLQRVHAALTRPAGGADRLEAESRLFWLLGELVSRYAVPEPRRDIRAVGGVGRQVMTRLADQVTCPPALSEMAAEIGLSRYQLLRSFRAEVGMPPFAWLAQYRVARARTLLERGHSPAAAAAAAGFADQAHLTRWFRRIVGVTPAVYRNGVQDTGTRRGQGSLPRPAKRNGGGAEDEVVCEPQGMGSVRDHVRGVGHPLPADQGRGRRGLSPRCRFRPDGTGRAAAASPGAVVSQPGRAARQMAAARGIRSAGDDRRLGTAVARRTAPA